MKLLKIKWRNIGPYGNKLQELTLDPKGGLWMVTGKNGHGKCHIGTTKLLVSIEDQEVMKKFRDFLDK